MSNLRKDELKRLLSAINKELRKHGGNENTIKVTKLKSEQIEFLLELFNFHLEIYKDFVRIKLEEFYAEDIKGLINYKMPVNIHKINISEKYGENDIWELVIGRQKFGSTEVILNLEKWKILDYILVD